jgi:hypothetical protein
MLSKKINDNFLEKKNIIDKIISPEDLKKANINILDDKLLEVKNSSNKKLIANYSIIGYYNLHSSLFIWAWANPFLEINLSNSIKLKIQNIKLSGDKKELYNYMINNDSLMITGENIDELFKLVLYITKGKWIISKKQGDKSNIIEFILINNIVQNNM